MAEVELCTLSMTVCVMFMQGVLPFLRSFSSDLNVCHHWGCVSFKMFGFVGNFVKIGVDTCSRAVFILTPDVLKPIRTIKIHCYYSPKLLYLSFNW